MVSNEIIQFFEPILVRRDIPETVRGVLNEQDIAIITKIGMPGGIMDLDFTSAIDFNTNGDVVLEKNHYEKDIVLVPSSGNIWRMGPTPSYMARSLANLIRQLYVYDHLWKVVIPEMQFGNYRENRNHKKYAAFLEAELLKIDPELLEKDVVYFWGGFIEDIDHGIVG